MAKSIISKIGVDTKNCPIFCESMQGEITAESLDDLIGDFNRTPYNPEDPASRSYLQKCWILFKRDYELGQVQNQDGTLCSHYPPTILIPEREKLPKTCLEEGHELLKTMSLGRERSRSTADLEGWVHVDTGRDDVIKSLDVNLSESGISPLIEEQHNGMVIIPKPNSEGEVNDACNLSQLFLTARFARARSRFVVPVLIYKGNNLCRGATLSVGAEQFGRTGWDFFSTGGEGVEEDGASHLPDRSRLGRQEQLCDRVRGQDVRLLKALRVRLICDLMYQQKRLKFMLPVASSEKVDKAGRYREFHLASMPYPGCESFRGYQSKGLNSDKLRFDWKGSKVDATLTIPEGVTPKPLGIDWTRYKEWSIKDLTSCYLRFLLYQMESLDGGVLLHCISGWDRTPMIISLLRLSLWADGLVHVSLSPLEILFFTIAYDWRLFGHKLNERNAKSEEIFYFGMDYIQHMTGSEFSIHCGLQKLDYTPGSVEVRKYKLLEVRRIFIESYHEIIIPKCIKFSQLT